MLFFTPIQLLMDYNDDREWTFFVDHCLQWWQLLLEGTISLWEGPVSWSWSRELQRNSSFPGRRTQRNEW